MVSNASKLMVSRVVVAVLGWAGTLLIIRRLTIEAWGQFSFVFSFLSLMVIFTNIVSSRVAVRGLIDAEDKGAYAGSYVLLRFTLGIVGYAFAIAFVVVGQYPASVVRATILAGLVIVLATPSAGYEALFQVEGGLGTVAVAGALGQVAQFVLTILLALRGSSLVIFCLPAVLCEVVTMGWKLRALHPMVRIRYRVVRRTWMDLLRTGVPYAIGGALYTVYYSIDSVMLSKMDTFRAVGIYGIAYKFAGIVGFIPVAMSTAILAPLVRSWPGDPAVFWGTCRRAVIFLVLVAVPITFEFILFSEPTIRLLYGTTYAEAARATRLVVTSECLGFFTILGVTTLLALNRNVLYPLATLAGVVVNVALNLFVIPRYSYNGAAVDTLLTEMVVFTLVWVPILRTAGRGPLPLLVIAKTIGAGGICAVGGALLNTVAPWPVAATISGLAYVAIVHFARVPGAGGLPALLREEL